MKLSLTTQAGLLAVSRTAAQVFNALAGVVIVRFISQEDYGTFRQVYLLFATLVVLTDLGLSESLYYFLPRYPERKRKLILRSAAVVGLAQVVTGIAIVALGSQIGRFFNNPSLPPFLGLLAVYLGLSAVARLWEVQLVSEQRTPLAALVSGSFETLKVALLFVSLVIRPGIEGLMWALVVASLAKAAAYGLFLLQEFRAGGSASSVDAREQMNYSVALWLPGILNTLALYAHQYIVGYSFTPAEYAVYAVACFQVPLVGVLTTSIIEVMLVRVTVARSQGNEDEVRQVWYSASIKSLVIFMPLAMGLAVLAYPLIVVLFTAKYAAAAPLFAILMAGLPLNAVFTNNMLRAYGAMSDYAKFYTARLVLGLLLGIAGVVWMGMWGVALSSVATLYLIVAWQLKRVAQLLHVNFAAVLPWRAIGKVLLASGAACIPASACAQWIAHPAVALAVGLVSYGITYAWLALTMRLVTQEEFLRVMDEAWRLLARLRPGVKAA